MVPDEILVAGGGIGGLATALSLHGAGRSVRVFEAVPTLEPLGVGINLLPHAVRELDALGLLPELERIGVPCRALAYFTKRGEPIVMGGLHDGVSARVVGRESSRGHGHRFLLRKAT